MVQVLPGARAEPRRRSVARALFRAAQVATCVLLAGCGARYSPFEIDGKLSKALVSASTYMQQQRQLEAEQLLRAIQRIDPQFFGLQPLLDKLPAGERDLFRPTLLGVNRARRYAAPPDLGRRVAYYLPDRLLDALDVLSVEAHGGVGAFGSVHFTERARAAAGARVVGGIGSYFRRNLFGTRVQGDAALHAFGLGPLRSAGIVAGPSGIASVNSDGSGARSPQAAVFQTYRDYWSVGASGTLGVFGFSVDLHLVQLADWLGGFLLLDLGQDDLASTRATQLRSSDLELLQQLAEIEQSPAMLAAYRRQRPGMRMPGGQ